MYCYHFRFDVSISGATFLTLGNKPCGWIHLVINFIGPAEGEGIRIYHDGVEVANDTTKSYGTCQHPACRPDGRIVVVDNTQKWVSDTAHFKWMNWHSSMRFCPRNKSQC